MFLLAWVFSWFTLGITALIVGIWDLIDFLVIICGGFKTVDGKDFV